MKPFNIAQVLADAGVNNDTSARKQIEYIPIGQIEADPGNFYDLPKLEELANSISIIGLQEPVVVRPVEDGRYRIISGHRRTAALHILIDRGEHDDKVMCIVERQQESEALTQLKLIMGNSENRVLTSAEQARQVEETQQLIYQLKQEGFDFPGRVRDYVSDICKISTGKIARLNVIRNQLIPNFMKLWESGAINDSVAYILAGQVPKRQKAVWSAQTGDGKKTFKCTADWLVSIFGDMDYVEEVYGKLTCQKNSTSVCDFRDCLLMRAAGLGQYYSLRYECRGCCKTCSSLLNCKHSCPRAADAKNKKKDVAKAAELKAAEDKKAREQSIVDMIAKCYSRVGQLRAEHGISEEDYLKAADGYCTISNTEDLRRMESGECRINDYLPGNLYRGTAMALVATADLLGCSIDYLLGRTDVKGIADAPAAEPEKCVKVDTWYTGDPPEPGDYIAYGLWDGDEACYMATWDDDGWDMGTVCLDSISAWAYPPDRAVPASDVPAADPGNVSTLTPDSAYEDSCITGMSGSGRCGAAHYCSEPHDCCLQCDKDCSARCGWIGRKEDA